MESFEDAAILLSMRPYLDKGVVVSALTRTHGRHAGFAYKSALSGAEIGTLADMKWEARVSDQLGTFKHVDIDRAIAPLVIGEPVKLHLLQSLCGVADVLLPEREPHPDVYEATAAYLNALPEMDDALVAGASYVMWELLVLRALGYGLDLSQCAATGTTDDLIYVSPKTGKAVCEAAGAPYKDRLLRLPPFLRRGAGLMAQDVRDGLLITQTFFEKWVMAHMSAQLPDLRYSLAQRFS